MASFQPNAEAIEDIETTLQEAGNASRAALERIQELQQNHDFFTYCACILAKETREERQHSRQLAGYYLKNNIGNPMCTNNPHVQEFVMDTLGDANPHVRRAVGSIVTTAVLREVWSPDIVNALLPRLRGDENSVDGTMMTLSSLVEDHVELLDFSGLTEPIINAIIPFLGHSSQRVREFAMLAVSVLLEQAGCRMEGCTFAVLGGCITSIAELLLSALGSGPSNKEAQYCLRGLVLSLVYHEQMSACFAQVGEVMLKATEEATDEDIRKEAVEFWRAVLYFPSFSEAARPLMPRILPVILGCMLYSEMELGMMGARECDWDVEDRIDDVKPRAYEGRSHRTKRDDDDGDDDDGGGADEVEQHNLRRVAAIVLDDIAEHYGDEILSTALGVIGDMLNSTSDWKVVEAGILAIGAVADGCYTGMFGYLDEIATRLLEMIAADATNFLVKNTALWAIGKYPNYLMEPTKTDVLARYVQAVLGLMENRSKLIQETATACLQELVDAATDGELAPFMTTIVETINRCFKLPYQLKNRYLLFECVQSVCYRFGRELSDERTLNTLMEPMMYFWSNTDNDSPMIFPFFQSMSFVCDALGPFLEPVAADVFARSYGMVVFHLDLRRAAAQQRDVELPEPEYLVCALDLLSAILEAMGSALEPLVAQNEPNFMGYLLAAANDEEPQVRRSAFAVIGDMCSGCVSHCQTVLDDLCNAMVSNLQNPRPETLSIKVASNVAWSFGELIANQNVVGDLPQVGPQHTRAMMPLMMDVLAAVESEEDRNVADNACLAIGRILALDPESLSSTRVGLQFVPKWLQYVRNIKNMPQKDQAVRGLLGVVEGNAGFVAESVGLWIDLFVSLQPAPDLREEIKQLLLAVKNGMGGSWAAAVNSISRETVNTLYKVYGVR